MSFTLKDYGLIEPPSWSVAPPWATHQLRRNGLGVAYRWVRKDGDGRYLANPPGSELDVVLYTHGPDAWAMASARPAPSPPSWDQAPPWATHQLWRLASGSLEFSWAEKVGPDYVGAPVEKFNRTKFIMEDYCTPLGSHWKVREARPTPPPKPVAASALMVDLKRSVERLLALPDDCANLCWEAQEAERKHRRDQFEKAAAAIEQALGLRAGALA